MTQQEEFLINQLFAGDEDDDLQDFEGLDNEEE